MFTLFLQPCCCFYQTKLPTSSAKLHAHAVKRSLSTHSNQMADAGRYNMVLQVAAWERVMSHAVDTLLQLRGEDLQPPLDLISRLIMTNQAAFQQQYIQAGGLSQPVLTRCADCHTPG